MTSTTIQHYRLEDMIGRGGMSEVFRAVDTRLRRSVAIKFMRDTTGEADATVHRFLREARAASALNHPNIVVVYDIGESSDGRPYIVQEFIDGVTLRTLMNEAMPLPTLVEVGRQIARALAAAHTAGIVHRDIKPENVMLRGDGYVKVLDFGLARIPDIETETGTAPTRVAHDTEPGLLLGTTAYMSPEQARGAPAGAAADIFAFGITLYEMAGGRRPFAAATTPAVLAAILLDEPRPLSQLNASVPPVLENLVHRMLAKNPDLRPSALDIEAELALLVGNPAHASGFERVSAADRETVGREAEREQMWRVYQRVRDGCGKVLSVMGEPGIGKTILVEHFLAELAMLPERPFVVGGRCSERLAGAEAYLPVLEALDSLLHGSSWSSVETLIKTLAPNWYVQVAHAGSNQESIARVREEAPAASQERMKRELGALLLEASRLRPFVLFLDDLQWADVSTIDMLNYLAGRLDQMRLLVVATYRPADMTLGHHPFLSIRGDLRAHGVLEEIPLGFLQRRDVERYLAVMFPHHRFPATLAQMIHDKTEGHPLFMVDVVRYLRDSGSIVEEDEGWVLARSEAEAIREVPASMRGMIARKIERLDETDRKLLVAASVQGHEFDSAVIAEAIEMPPAEAEERLDTLEQVHAFVKRVKEHEFPDLTLSLQYEFVHARYQNGLYASLQPTRRAALSARVARSLVTHYGDDRAPVAGRLAALFETARDFGISAQYFCEGAPRGRIVRVP
jgi:tRNA A-37 threonylcarbamoyl transferase component Bud32